MAPDGTRRARFASASRVVGGMSVVTAPRTMPSMRGSLGMTPIASASRAAGNRADQMILARQRDG
jgi:hypothetical protein